MSMWWGGDSSVPGVGRQWRCPWGGEATAVSMWWGGDGGVPGVGRAIAGILGFGRSLGWS